MLKGNLSGFSLGEILQSLAINKHTGTLSLMIPGTAPKHVYFENGDIRFFSHGASKTPRIGEILLRAGKLYETQLQEALKEAKASGKLLGRVLLERGYISEDDIHRALEMKIREELYELFSLEEGDFEFLMNECPDDLFDALQKSVEIRLPTSGVIMEGLRRVDEWKLIHDRIPTENAIFTPTGKPVPEESEAPVDTIFPLIDGHSPVTDLVSAYPGPRFDVLKSIYDLLDAGTIRPLSVSELVERAGEFRDLRNYPAAANYLRFAAELASEEPQIWIDLAECLGKFYQEDEAKGALVKALRLAFDQGDWDRAAIVAEKFPANAQLPPRDMHMLLRTFLHLRMTKKALWAGQELALTLQREGETQKAAEVLDSLLDLDPADLNLKVQIATLLQQVGETGRATEYYEEVAGALEDQKKLKDQIKILRIIADLHPKRADVKQKIATLLALQEKRERARKRRMTIAGAASIVLLVLTVIPLLYELKARELFSHAERMEQIALTTGDFTRTKNAYEELLRRYSWSTKVHETRLALQRIGMIERRLVETLKSKEENRRKLLEDRLKNLDQAIADALEKAEKAEESRELEAAHRFYRHAMKLAEGTPKLPRMRLPVLIKSYPGGADVLIDGKPAGKTPAIYHYEPGAKVEVRITRSGCEPVEEMVTLEDQYTLEFKLPRRPLAELALPSNFDQPLYDLGVDNLVGFPSRDGHVYAFDARTNDIAWKDRVGYFGDRLSDLHVDGGRIYVGTVEDQLIVYDARTGRRYWTAGKIRGPVLAAPATSPDHRRVAVANVFGTVYLLEYEDGKEVDAFTTENEVLASPVFAGDYLVVGSTDSHVYSYHMPSRAIAHIVELTDRVEADPVVYDGDVIFGTRDGRVHRVVPSSHKASWSIRITEQTITGILRREDRVIVASSSGDIFSVDPASGAVDNHWLPARSRTGGMRADGDILYVGYQSGLLVAWDVRQNELAWNWQAESSINTKPLILDRLLYVACNSGTVQVLEILE